MVEDADAATPLDLSEAAAVLDVHYQTAYRWVRDGSLKARKVGKSYRVERRDLDRFIEHRQAGSPPRSINVRDWAQQSDRLYDAVLAGDERAASDQLDRLVRGGLPAVELCDQLLAPVLRRVGEEWAAGTVSIADEHRATAIIERLLSRLPSRRTRARGTAVVATPAGEQHRLPSLMAAIALRQDGWRVHHLGSDLPEAELLAFLERERPDLLVLSPTAASARAVRVAEAAAGRAGVSVLTGGSGRRLADLVIEARSLPAES